MYQKTKNRALLLLFSVFFFYLVLYPVRGFAFFEVDQIETQNGINIWVVEDKTVPVISMNFSFRGGIALEQKGKEGITNLLAEMLTQGAGTYDSIAFQKKLDDLSIQMNFSAGRDHFFGSIKTTTEHKTDAFELLHTVLKSPRFDVSDMKRTKDRLVARLEQNQKNPDWLVWRNFNATYYEGHPYANPANGFIETIPAITAEDMRSFIDNNFSLDRLDIVFVGDITVAMAKQITEITFQGLPQTPPVQDSSFYENYHQPLEEDRIIHVDFDVPQTSIVMGRQGMHRNDPDFHAALVANYLIGGGSFSSILMQDIRVDKGLTYGISSSLSTQELSNLFFIRTSTRGESTKTMLKEIRNTLSRIQKKGFSKKQIRDAKTYLKGSLLLGLTSTDTIASALLRTRLDGFPPTYLGERGNHIEFVSEEDVERATQRLLGDLSFTTVLVGN